MGQYLGVKQLFKDFGSDHTEDVSEDINDDDAGGCELNI